MIPWDGCLCGVICTCGGDDWGEEYETLQAEHLAAADLDPDWPCSPDN